MGESKIIRDMQIQIEKMNRCSKVISRSGEGNIQFDLPKIVVIGSQSEGKSSVLESIVGKPFLPRGSDMVTRCPIEIHLHHEASLSAKEDYAIFARDRYDEAKKIDNIENITKEIEFRTSRRASNKQVSKDSIVLEIYSASVINLQLVDLPGFVQNPLPDQPPDIQKQIEELVTYFTSKSNTLILAISSGTDDIVNSVAIKHALLVDPRLERTIGVITKMDMLIDPGKKASIVKVLNNETIPLRKGYVGVINANLDQLKRNASLESVRQGEMAFFQREDSYKHLLGKIGTQYLQNYLHREFYQIIRSKLPEIIISAQKEIRSINGELKKLNYSEDKDKETGKDQVQKKIRDYCEAVIVALEGNSIKVNVDEVEAGALIKQCLKARIEEACKEAMMVDDQIVHRKMINIVLNLTAAHDFFLPNGLSFRIMVGILADQFKDPLKNLVEEITQLLMTHLKKIADRVLSVNPNLKSEVLDIVLKRTDEYREACFQDVERQIEVQKIYINSFHPDFERYKKMLGGFRQNKEGEDEDIAETSGIMRDLSSGNPFSDVRMGLFLKLQKDLKMVNETKGVIAAPTDTDGAAGFFLELVFAYMAIIDKTLNDMAQRLIMFHLVHKVINYFEDPKILNLEKQNIEENECRILLESNSTDQIKIQDLLDKRRDVTEALNILNEDD